MPWCVKNTGINGHLMKNGFLKNHTLSCNTCCTIRQKSSTCRSKVLSAASREQVVSTDMLVLSSAVKQSGLTSLQIKCFLQGDSEFYSLATPNHIKLRRRHVHEPLWCEAIIAYATRANVTFCLSGTPFVQVRIFFTQ